MKAEKNAPGSIVPPRPKPPATKSTPPRPAARAAVPRPTPSTPAPKVEPIVEEIAEEIVLEAADVVEEKEPEPAPPPPIALPPPPVALPPPPAMPRIDARPPMRSLAPSLPSPYELDSIRKSSPPVLARRRQLQKLVASAVGIAWFICLAALGQSALRSLLASVAGR